VLLASEDEVVGQKERIRILLATHIRAVSSDEEQPAPGFEETREVAQELSWIRKVR
jgi:hypothetical protein